MTFQLLIASLGPWLLKSEKCLGHNPFPVHLQADIMHLTDVAVRRQLFLDVLDGTKALVSMSRRSPFPEVTQGPHNLVVA